MSQRNLNSILHNPRIPTLPAVAVRVLELTRSDTVNLSEVAEVVENDPALSIKIIRTINSSYYGLSRPCSTIHQAIVYLGLDAVKTLVLGFSLVESIDGGGEEDVTFDYVDFWRRSIYSAVAARELATRCESCDPDETFICALVQDLGMVALNRTFRDVYLQTVDLAGGDHAKLPDIERRALELDHAQVGAAIAERWNMPGQLVAVIRHHHQPEKAPEAWRDLARIVALAGQAAALTRTSDAATNYDAFKREAQQLAGLDADAAREVLEAMANAAVELSSLFRVDIGERFRIDDVLDEAEELRIRRHLDALHQNDPPSAPAGTGQCHGGSSDNSLPEGGEPLNIWSAFHQSFDKATSSDQPLGLILAELEGFQALASQSDRDTALKVQHRVRDFLVEQLGGDARAGSLGDGRLLIVLPGADCTLATRTAEDLRKRVLTAPVEFAPKASRWRVARPSNESIILTFGVVAYDPDSPVSILSAQHMLRVVEQAVDTARRAGPGSVRVYRPRISPTQAA